VAYARLDWISNAMTEAFADLHERDGVLPRSFDAYKGQIADNEQQERGYDERQKWFGKEEREQMQPYERAAMKISGEESENHGDKLPQHYR
jgi:hypothetical protein